MEQLLNKYVNQKCTEDEKLYVRNYIEADFSRCFEMIRLMKAKAYNEMGLETTIPQPEESISLGGLFGFLNEEENIGELGESEMMYGTNRELMDEYLSALDLTSESESISAAEFLSMLKDYIDISD